MIDLSTIRPAELAERAFVEGEDAALEDAHRTLYALYADRVWRHPLGVRPESVQAELDQVRGVFERGFRDWLSDRRPAVAQPDDLAGKSAAGRFMELATGDQPFDDPDWGRFVREEIALDQLRSIVAQRSLFFLREPDPWIYAVPTLTGVAKAGLIDLLLDEYGWGKLERMHSSVYARLMRALDLDDRPGAYEPTATWQFLATLNHQWMLALTPGMSRQLLGVVYLTEAGSPPAMSNYLAAWERLGIVDPEVLEFYTIHVSADENHRDVALDEVLLPVVRSEPGAAAEIAVGIVDGRMLEADFARACRVEAAVGA